MPQKRHPYLGIKNITQRFLLGIVIDQINVFSTGMENVLLCCKETLEELGQIQGRTVEQIDIATDINLEHTKFRP